MTVLSYLFESASTWDLWTMLSDTLTVLSWSILFSHRACHCRHLALGPGVFAFGHVSILLGFGVGVIRRAYLVAQSLRESIDFL